MPNASPSQGEKVDARSLTARLAQYREPNDIRSIVEIVITAAPLVGIWALMWASVHFGYVWLCLLLAVPAAGLLVRLFMIQHDCGHGAFFRARAANDWVGRVFGVFTLTPYDCWRRSHAIHHATSGNLDRRGIGDVETWTVSEYLSRSPLRRFGYRVYRHPLVMFGIAPTYLFVLQHRIPLGLMRSGWLPWVSTMATNAGIALFVAMLIWALGVGPFLLVHLPITLLAASIGVWLFYVQHQFEETAWEGARTWNLHETALHGSSHYDLPAVLRWFTANIGVHHVHHLSQPHPVLPFGPGASRQSGAAQRQQADAGREPWLRAPGVMGRGRAAAYLVPRGAGPLRPRRRRPACRSSSPCLSAVTS